MPSLIKRWCQSTIDRSTIRSIDSSLDQLRLPHNVNVPFLDSILNASQWKAKNNRLFVLNVGVPIVTLHLPQLLASHFLLYSMAVKMLHAPESIEEINLAEDLMNYYCKTAGLIYDRSIEIYSLHAHIHLAQQVRKHGGLAHTSAFGFESCIRFISKKAHGSKHLGTQISYWIDLQTIMNTHPVNPPTVTTINEIKWLDNRLDPYRTILDQQIVLNAVNLDSCNFYLRLKSLFVIYHTTIYSQPFKCKSYIISYIDSISKSVHYGNIILFMKEGSRLFAFVQKYTLNSTLITDYLGIPSSLHSQANKLFPILRLTNTFVLIPVDSIRHKYNSIAVVKAKQCCPAEHDGFVFVQSGKKKSTGVILEEGSLSQCSAAADRLTKKTVNPEIESDYERNNNMNQLKQPATTATFTSLNSIPFTEKNSNGQPRLASVIMTSTDNSANDVRSGQSINNSSLNENEDVLLELPKVACTTTRSTSNNLNKPTNTHHPKKSILKSKRFKQSNGELSSTILFQN
ncbi:unnamed protein product, partial [Rotaria magnacalcarata]